MRTATASLPQHYGKTPCLLKIYEQPPESFQVLLGMLGVEAKTIRAPSLICELVHGATPSFRDLLRYSFAHGGKDGHPYPVARANHDRSVATLEDALRRAKMGEGERLAALRRLGSWEKAPRLRVTMSRG